MKKTILILMVLLTIPIVFAGTVTRSLSKISPSAGDTVTVTLTIDTDTGDKAILMHDESPFTITGTQTNIFEDGLLSNTQVQDATRTYSFTIPVGTTGTHDFNGKYTVNGAESPIGGTSSFTIGVCTPNTCNGLGYNCGSWSDGCGGNLNCGSCSGNETCSSGTCTTAAPEKCEFWEKKVGSTCEMNTGIIVLFIVLLFALRMFGG
jgi:hypothetical protein